MVEYAPGGIGDLIDDFIDYVIVGPITNPVTGDYCGTGWCGVRDDAPEKAKKSFKRWFKSYYEAQTIIIND